MPAVEQADRRGTLELGGHHGACHRIRRLVEFPECQSPVVVGQGRRIAVALRRIGQEPTERAVTAQRPGSTQQLCGIGEIDHSAALQHAHSAQQIHRMRGHGRSMMSSTTAAGSSNWGQCPDRGSTTRELPGICLCNVRLASTGMMRSLAPCATTAGQPTRRPR